MVDLNLPAEWRGQYMRYYEGAEIAVGAADALRLTLALMTDEKRAITDER